MLAGAQRGGAPRAATPVSEFKPSPPTVSSAGNNEDWNQQVREGHFEKPLVDTQASKADEGQESIRGILEPLGDNGLFDVSVVGCGPAGLAMAAELGKRGLSVALIGRDLPFTNNYGVWADEFEALGLTHTLDHTWQETVCYFGLSPMVKLGRAYSRVDRGKLRQHLLEQCRRHGVRFLAGEVTAVGECDNATECHIECADGATVSSRLVMMCAGQAAGKFLEYDEGAPEVAVQTAYGIEAEVEGYEGAFDVHSMLFMDFRRHHTGYWNASAADRVAAAGPQYSDYTWGSSREVPSFLYAMPLDNGHVFLEETCLVSRPTLPFATLKRRLERRLDALGIKVKRVVEEEWSYIPVGGPLPKDKQFIVPFGAAANLVHPATGYSISRSFREAPVLAESIAGVLQAAGRQHSVREASEAVWATLWPLEKRRQACFHVFGMELLLNLDLAMINSFFETFFRLPRYYWRGFLSSNLSSSELIVFALLTFAIAPNSIRMRLMQHLVSDPSGAYMLSIYTQALRNLLSADSLYSHSR